MCSLYNIYVELYSGFVQTTYVACTKHMHLICRAHITFVLPAPQVLSRVAPITTTEAIPARPDDPPGMNHGASPRITSKISIVQHDPVKLAAQQENIGIASCSKRTVTRVRANVRAFGAPYAPKAAQTPCSRIPSHVLDALLDRLLIKPNLYLDEMADFVWDECGLYVSEHSVRMSLEAYDWSKKKTRRVEVLHSLILHPAPYNVLIISVLNSSPHAPNVPCDNP
jgi:hypothetical protein